MRTTRQKHKSKAREQEKRSARRTAKKADPTRDLRLAFSEWEAEALAGEKHLWSNIEHGDDARCRMLVALRDFLES